MEADRQDLCRCGHRRYMHESDGACNGIADGDGACGCKQVVLAYFDSLCICGENYSEEARMPPKPCPNCGETRPLDWNYRAKEDKSVFPTRR